MTGGWRGAGVLKTLKYNDERFENASVEFDEEVCVFEGSVLTPTPYVQTAAEWVSDVKDYSDEIVANRNVWAFGWEIAHAAVSRRLPISLDTIVALTHMYPYTLYSHVSLHIVARTHMYTHAATVWDLSLVQGPFSVAPCRNLSPSL